MAEYYNPYADDEAKITRRRRMAEMLGAQAMEPIEQSSFRGIPAPISPAAGLAKALTAFASVKGGQRADAESAALKGKRTADADADYTDLLAAMKGGRLDPETGSRLRTPEARSSFLDLYGKQKPEEKPKPMGSPFELAGEEGRPVKWQMQDNGQIFQLGLSYVDPNDALKARGIDPAKIREYEYFSKLTPEQKEQFLLVSRANPWVDLGDVKALPNPVNPNAPLAQMPVGTPPKTDIDAVNNRVVTAPAVPGSPRSDLPMPGGAQPSAAPQMPGAQPAPAPQGPTVSQLPPRNNDLSALNKSENTLKAWQNKVSGTVAAIDQATNLLGWTTTGLPGAVLRFGPTEARTLQNLITQIQANLGFEELAEMRANSPNGSALGSVTEKETALLQATRGVLDPMDPDIGNKLQNIKKLYGELMAERAAALEKDKAVLTRGGPQSLMPAAERSLDELLQKYGG